MNLPRLFVALDGSCVKVERCAYALSNVQRRDFGYKINLDYFLRNGANPVKSFGETYRPLFVDLKMWNGRRTMKEVSRILKEMRVFAFNVYALADDQLEAVIEEVGNDGPKIFALTVLSHYTDEYCRIHFRRSLRETVRHLTATAINRGCHGIILPGTCLDAVSDLSTIKVATGIRPAWFQDNRHEQVVTPFQAVENGADSLVCGSPITRAHDPCAALQEIFAEM